MSPTDAVDPVRSIEALDVLPLPVRMRMMEDALEVGLKYSTKLAEVIAQAVPEMDFDAEEGADAGAVGRQNLKQWIEEAGEHYNHESLIFWM